jgi:hypothetical protein
VPNSIPPLNTGRSSCECPLLSVGGDDEHAWYTCCSATCIVVALPRFGPVDSSVPKLRIHRGWAPLQTGVQWAQKLAHEVHWCGGAAARRLRAHLQTWRRIRSPGTNSKAVCPMLSSRCLIKADLSVWSEGSATRTIPSDMFEDTPLVFTTQSLGRAGEQTHETNR